MRDQTWDRDGKLIADLEFVREPEGLMCYDRLSGVSRHAEAHEVQRWHDLEKLKATLAKADPVEVFSPSFLQRLWKFVGG
jgi:hypothetical protein